METSTAVPGATQRAGAWGLEQHVSDVVAGVVDNVSPGAEAGGGGGRGGAPKRRATWGPGAAAAVAAGAGSGVAGLQSGGP